MADLLRCRFHILWLAIFVLGCWGNKDKTTHTFSRAFSSTEEKLEFFKSYVSPHSEIKDLDFLIHYKDNSGGSIPGPSDWDIIAIIKIDNDKIPLWIEDMEQLENPPSIQLLEKLELPAGRWEISSKPVCYASKGKIVFIHKPEKSIILYYSTMAPFDFN